MGKDKRHFTHEEYERIVRLIDELEQTKKLNPRDISREKSIRNELRGIGLQWKEVSTVLPNGKDYNVENFHRLIALEVIKIDGGISDRAVETRLSDKNDEPALRKSRANSDECYVIDLCDEVLGYKASRQHRFDFLRGDGDRGDKLPVDAYYPALNLVIEYYEKQHTESVALFNRDTTVSGVSRDEQRRIYDERRKEILPKHGINIIIISYSDFGTSKKLRRIREHDIEVVRNALKQYIR